ncbi:nucleotide exchange factor GrpE [bacterium]|nr:nucleotide exchange factor GrpE [bacterium]
MSRSSWLKRWLWAGTFEFQAEPLALWEGEAPVRASDPRDLLGQVTAALKELWRLVDLTESMEEKQEEGSSVELRSIARSMLPVLDGLDRIVDYASQHRSDSEEFENWAKAVEGVQIRLSRTMERIGLQPLSTVGTEVDLALHDVVATVRTREYPENTIVAERQKGYYFRGRLLRDAKVVVALSS